MTAESVRLSEAKRSLLQKYLHGGVQRSPTEGAPISPRPPGEAIPLSYEQEHIWLHCHLAADLPLYNELLTVWRRGPLDVSALERSLSEIIRRHEAWRTTFDTTDERPVQVILSPPTISLPVIDLRGLPEAEGEREALRLATEEARRPFDLATGPLLRAKLIRLAEAEHRLYVTLHQIIFDGVSAYSVFLPELIALYEAFAAGEASPLPEPVVQYPDFAHWQRQRLRGDVLSAQMDYWRLQLADAPTALEVRTDRARPKVQTFRGRQAAFALPKSLSEELKRLGQREGATLFMTLLAAFKVLLHRYTGQEDIFVGTAISSRKLFEVERILGVFLNTLVLRTRLSGELSFRELLARVREVTLEGVAHSDVPFPLLIKELQPWRDPGRNPLFQVTFVLEPPMPAPSPGWDLTQMDVDIGIARVDLYFQLDDRPEGLLGHIRYNSALWDASTISRLVEHFHVLLEGIVTNADLPLSAIPILTPGERLGVAGHPDLAVRPSNPFVTFEQEEVEQSIPQRFAKQVAKYPHRIGVRTGRAVWTYEALNQAANRVAHALSTVPDVGGARVALLLDHDAPMQTGILGVLKAGGAYVPLDPTHPTERLAHILNDSLVAAVLTSKKNLTLAAELAEGAVKIFEIEDILSGPNAPEYGGPSSPDHLAYILYTSGSTGRPKGVAQNHRNVLHFIRAYTNNLHICPDDRLTLMSSYSVDAAVMDIFGALLNGATLCPIDIRDVGLRGLCERLTEDRVTIYHSTPTLYRHFVNALARDPKVPTVRLVVLGGEEVRREDVEFYKERFAPDCLFVNGFGPTESTVSLQYFLNRQATVDRRSVPIGYPVEQTEVSLLSRDGRPEQVYGEIAIRSPYLALGYWQRPALTRMAFRPDPAGGKNRVYRTGDMGRLLPDGSIEFCGRKDLQVKIQGFRVELGEIEAALAQHPAVTEAAATVWEASDGEKRIIAHWVADGQPPSTDAMRDFLRKRLPTYMIPSAFLRVDALPLTPSGKLDRTALLAMSEEQQVGRKEFVTPRNSFEIQLAQMWEELLNIRPVGIRDDFFELGGHSLLAARMMDAVARTLGRRLPLTTLFAGATVEDLARALSEQEIETCHRRFTVIHPEGSRPPFFFLHGDRRSGGSYCLNLARYVGPEQPFYAIHPHGLDGGSVPSTIEAMAEDHLSTLRAARSHGPYLLGGYCNGALVAFEMARRLVAAGEKVDLLVLLDPPPATRRLRLVEMATDSLGLLRGLDKERRLDRVVQTRRRALWLESRLWPAWACLRDSTRDGTIGPLVRQKLVRGVNKFAERLRPEGEEANVPAEGVREYLDTMYHRAVVSYVPRSYPGRITLLLSVDSWMGSRGWPRVARRLRRHLIPGNHANCITQHVHAVGARLGVCLGEAQDEQAQSKGVSDAEQFKR